MVHVIHQFTKPGGGNKIVRKILLHSYDRLDETSTIELQSDLDLVLSIDQKLKKRAAESAVLLATWNIQMLISPN